MTAISMRREAIDNLFAQQAPPFSHAGLWLSRGLKTLDGEQAGLKQAHIKQATEIPVPKIYETAFERWRSIVTSASTMAYWPGQLDGRLFIGTGGASVLETAITLSRTYGVPMIPGSAVKGLVRAYAQAARKAQLENALSHDQCATLFGVGGEDPDTDAVGAVIFHDAWWVPKGKPLAAEIVTVHHQDYYGSGDNTPVKQASDFDSPIPAPQIAAQGAFLFAVECGDKAWAEHTRDLLASALQDWGIGGKTAAGYGRFIVPTEQLSPLREQIRGELDKLKFSGAGKAGEWLSTAEKEADKVKARDIALELRRYYQNVLSQWDSNKAKERKRQERIEALIG